MDRRQFLGLVSLGYLFNTLPEITSDQIISNSNRSNNTDRFSNRTKSILQEFQQLSIYHSPIEQDTQEGRGIYPCPLPVCTEKEADMRSEKPAYLPFVLSPRRQTDALVRQGYQLLPLSIRRSTAFLIADRLAQYPELYIPYIQKKKSIVIIGSFVGFGKVSAETISQGFTTIENEETWRRERHLRELKQLELAIRLVQSLGKQVIDIVYAIGDSYFCDREPQAVPINVRQFYSYSEDFRQHMEMRVQHILRSHNLARLHRPLGWGADEAIWKAFARRLPNMKLRITMANPAAKHFYDAKRTTQEMVPSILRELNMTAVQENSFDAQVFIFDRYPSTEKGHYDFCEEFPINDPTQNHFDRKFIVENNIREMPDQEKAKTIVVDARNPNGALNSTYGMPDQLLPFSDQFLAFGAWGTFANVMGQTLAMAKLLHFALRYANSAAEKQHFRAIQRQILLEAIAHDIFVTGYGEAADRNHSNFKKWQESKGLTSKYIRSSSPIAECTTDPQTCNNYTDPKQVQEIYTQIEDFINEQMPKKIPSLGETRFKVVPQLWGMRESQVYASDGKWSFGGIYRTDLPQETFNPFFATKGTAKPFELKDLIQE